MSRKKTKVIVVGAGPVGTVAATYLAKNGIDVVLLEANADCAQDLRASTFHPPTLEMLERFGITQRLIEVGLKAPIYHFRERGTGEVVEFDMSELADVTRYPFRVQCEQYHLSRMLAEGLNELPNAEVLFNHRVVGIEQHRDGVNIDVETPLAIKQFGADFVIGADGANSIVRKWLGIDFDGFTYPEKFLCFTTKEPLEQHIDGLCHVNYVSDPREWLVLLRVPSLWRILVPADNNERDSELLSDTKKNDVLERLIGSGSKVQTEHRTIYRVHQRVAKKFVDGRIAIIGDAAHLNNPIGGFGMNSGIHDAFNLCKKLVGIIQSGHDPETALSRFEQQRRTTTHAFIQAQTIRNMEYLSDGRSEEHNKRKKQLIAIRNDNQLRREYLLRQSMIESLSQEDESDR